MKKIKNLFLIAFTFLFVFVVGYSLFINFSKDLDIDIQIEEALNQSTSFLEKEDQIISYLDRYKKTKFWKINLKKMVQKLNSFYPGVEIHIARRLPNHLKISLKKKNIILLLLKDHEFFYSVYYEGQIGSKKNSQESFNFPILRGEVFWGNLDLRRRVISILSILPEKGMFFSSQNISEISYNSKNNSLFFHLIPGRYTLELRQITQKKIEHIDFVLKYLIQKGERGGLIDARLDKKIIVKNLD